MVPAPVWRYPCPCNGTWLPLVGRTARPSHTSPIVIAYIPESFPEPHYYYGRDDNGSIHDIDTL